MAAAKSAEKKRGILDALDKRMSASQPANAPGKGAEASDGPYSKLCPSISNGPLGALFQLHKARDESFSARTSVTNLLVANTNFVGDVGGTNDDRLHETVLLLDSKATQGGATERARERARLGRSKRSRKCLSLRQHRKLGSFDLPPDARRHDSYQQLREMWIEYADSLISNCSETIMHSRLLTADLHGATLAVVDCKNCTLIGTQGIMVRETEKCFGLITSKDKLQVIPKAGTTFRLKVKNSVVTLFGSSLALRGDCLDPAQLPFPTAAHLFNDTETRQGLELCIVNA